MIFPGNAFKQAARARHAARRKGLPADLTGEAWAQTLRDYNWSCAYCGNPYATLDHFIPLDHYGGTTVDNCVPSCWTCNQTKANIHPRFITFISRNILLKIDHYLQTRRHMQVGERKWWQKQENIVLFDSIKSMEYTHMEIQDQTPYEQSLVSGHEIRLVSDESLRLQICTKGYSHQEARGSSYSAELTAIEAYELATNILRAAQPILKQSLIGTQQRLPTWSN